MRGAGSPQRLTRVSKVLLDACKDGSIWNDILLERDDIHTVTFEVASTIVFHKDYHFHPELCADIPRKELRLLLLFPLARDRPHIDTNECSSLHAINTAINAHIGECNPRQVQMVICIGDMRYRISGLPKGSKLYLQCARVLNIYKANEAAHHPFVPMLVATDGHFDQWGWFPLFGEERDHSFIHPERIHWINHRAHMPWCCDTSEPKPASVPHGVLRDRAVAHLAERASVPDHELRKYYPEHYAGRSVIDNDRDEELATQKKQQDGSIPPSSTDDDDDSGISVFISDFPTPRYPLPNRKHEQAALDDFFSDASPASADDAIVGDFDQSERSSGGGDDSSHALRAKAPLATIVLVEPRDSTARRKPARHTE